jgi:virulence-associated protein VapD
MYAVAFDLVVAGTEQHHPKGVAQATPRLGSTCRAWFPACTGQSLRD